jgi:cytochrome d ubiquinol oxidase subunit I
MLAMPFPYIANEAGWTVSEVGRQPWTVYELVRTADSTSLNVSGGMTVFTLMGFMGLYLLLGALYALIFIRIVYDGPSGQAHGHGVEAPA